MKTDTCIFPVSASEGLEVSDLRVLRVTWNAPDERTSADFIGACIAVAEEQENGEPLTLAGILAGIPASGQLDLTNPIHKALHAEGVRTVETLWSGHLAEVPDLTNPLAD